jgi:predicted enzyme related to lactoylglutathione lyase
MALHRGLRLDDGPLNHFWEKSMFKKMLSYGVLAGLLVGVPLSVITISMSGQTMMRYGMVIGYLIMLVALSAVFVAVKRHRDAELGGVIKFWPAFGLGLGISFIAGVLYVISWESACAIAHLDFAGSYAKAMIAQQQAKGVSADALAKFTAQMEQFKAQYANPFYRWPMTFMEIFPVGVLVSLVSAALLRNSRFLPSRHAGRPITAAAMAVLLICGIYSPSRGLASDAAAPDKTGKAVLKRVTGIGGIAIRAKEPAKLREWYKVHLGIDVQVWGGTAFHWVDGTGAPANGTTAWSISNGADFAPSNASFMVNYRVADLTALLKVLRDEGCEVLDKVVDSEYGKFGWLMDPEGNKVELWQPPPGK